MLGLTQKQAQQKIEKFGKNVLEAKSANPWWKILARQFTDLLVIILILAAGVSFFFGEEKTDAYVILFIIVLNAGIGFVQEFRTEKTLEALKKMIHPEIRVFRDGKETLLPTEMLVPGDVVILGEGDKIPADGQVLEAHSLKIEESALTGESLPLEKKAKDDLFMGTTVVHGSGMYEVTKTGMETKFGQIAKLTTETKQTKSPLQKELEHIGVFVTKITGIICVILFVLGFFRGADTHSLADKLIESLMFAVSVAIAAVPEGLPTTITIALALGATILARKKAIVKRLSSVETLGAVTTICSDKTGTLTKNEMTVRELYLADRSIYNVSGVGYNPHSGKVAYVGGYPKTAENTVLRDQLYEICEKCNEAMLVKKDKKYMVMGDPTEGSLITLVQKAGFDGHSPEDRKIDEIFPFDSDRKMMSVISDSIVQEKKKLVMVKGSPDQVLEKCTHWFDGEKTQELTTAKLNKIKSHYERMAENALRVLAFAYRDIHKNEKIEDEKKAEQHLVFVGLVGMIDPPRESVRKSVEKCHTAGIRVVVITGDFGVTAEAIARELNIVHGNKVTVLTGDEVKDISDAELKKILKDRARPVIFARSLPEQKMRIVKILQELGEIVAMTGDGVNDAPALKKADIGVAMGITGTEVSKEAATMILTDDSFSSIVTAVQEGRRIYENLKKFIWFIFSCNIGELVVVFAAILFPMPMALTAILILAIDLGTDILPAIALGVDPAEPDLMERKPRDPKARVMSKKFVQYFVLTGTVIGLTVIGSFVWTLVRDGWQWGDTSANWPHAQTVAFASLVFVQLVNAFSARSEKISLFRHKWFDNHFLILAVLSSVLLVMLMIYVPFLNNILNTTPLDWSDWGVVAVASFLPLVVIEGRKIVLNKQK